MVGGGRAPMMVVLVDRDREAAGPVAVVGQTDRLLEGEEHHLRVRRAQPDDVVAVRDGAGLVGSGRLVRSGREWRVTVETVSRRPRPADLVLAVGAGDRERFTWLVEKAVELGVTAVIPLETARTRGVATGLRAQHIPKLRRQALEALKQCGSAWVCSVEEPVALETFLRRPISGSGWLTSGDGEPPPASLSGGPITALVGPEGGLEDDERRAVIAVGYQPVALGPHTLRFETAAIAAAAAVSAARQRGNHG
jgi:16S rRNA (uracil1498-N3)-methyltransferase